MRETMELEWGLQRHIVASPVFVKKPYLCKLWHVYFERSMFA